MIWSSKFIDDNENVRIISDVVNGVREEHGHSFMEIEYIKKGKVVQYINGERIECNVGDFLFFYIGDIHKYESKGEAEILNIIFDYKTFKNMMLHKHFPVEKRINSKIVFPNAEKKFLINLINMIEYEYRNKKYGYIYVVQNLLQCIVGLFLRYGTHNKLFTGNIDKILRIIEDDYTQSINQIANICGYSQNHISKIFKDAMGVSIKKYMNSKRMEKAYKLIKTTELTIEQIMEIIGLNNRTHFYNMFNEYWGKTPGQLRKKI